MLYLSDPPKLIVYTGIFGGYDKLHEPQDHSGIRFICYTDDPNLTSNVWEIRYCKADTNRHPRWQARQCKLLGFKDLNCEESVWIDGRYEFVSLLRMPYYNNMLIHTHPKRICSYAEVAFCLKHHIGDPDDLQRMVDIMQTVKFPKDFGLWWSAVLWRKHTQTTISFCEKWWKNMQIGSVRDQVSLPFTLWQTGIDFTSQQIACDIGNFHSFVKLIAHDHSKSDYH